MRSLSSHITAEIYFPGCNTLFLRTDEGCVLVDTPQQPIDAVRWRELTLAHGGVRYLINTEPHRDHTAGNAYFPGVQVVGQRGIAARYAKDLKVFEAMTGEPDIEVLKREDPDSVFLAESSEYPLNPPTVLFDDKLTLEVGAHQVQLMNHPGHTAMETTVFFPGEGVIATGDNVFSGVKSFLLETDPWALIDSLLKVAALDAAVIMPGHGEPITPAYLPTQVQIVENWVGLVEGYLDRGMTLKEALAEPVDVRRDIDPFPMPQRLWAMDATIDAANISNIFARAAARRGLDADLTGGWFFEDIVESALPVEAAVAGAEAAAV